MRCRVNPYKEGSFDGMSLNPLEVMFVKMKGSLLDQGSSAATTVQTLDRWMQHQVWRRGNRESSSGTACLMGSEEFEVQ